MTQRQKPDDHTHLWHDHPRRTARTPSHTAVHLALGVTLLLQPALSSLLRAQESAADGNVVPLRLDFGPGPVHDGFQQVLPDQQYSQERRLGFDLDSKADVFDSGSADALTRDGVTATAPFFFSAQLPEGNYRVSVVLGDASHGSTNTIKAESRRLMVERTTTDPGEYVTRTFTVNIRTPRLHGSRSVRLKDREIGVLHWDDKLTLEFNGSRPAVCALEIEPAPEATTVFLLGDSTVTDQPDEPWNSWGQMLTRFVGPDVAVANYAESGESLKSSLGARRVEKVFSLIQPGDYLLVQFGHNDMKDKATNALATYKSNLEMLVRQARDREAIPVLVTSMERKAGVRSPTLEAYPETVREVAHAEGVALIDLNAMSLSLYRALGSDLGAAFQDGTHHNAYGSYQLAKCVVRGIRLNQLPLADHLANDVALFDPDHPDPLQTFQIPASPGYSRTKPEGW